MRRGIVPDTALAAAAALLALLTLVLPDWIEVVFGIDPDAGSGALEWIVAVTCCLAAVALGARARRTIHGRHLNGASTSP